MNMRKGFTLIETIIYTGLISVVFTMALFAVFFLIETKDRAAARIEVEEETRFLMGKIAWMLSAATAINAPQPNATSTSLSVSRTGVPANPVMLDLVSDAVRIRYGTGDPVQLNGESVRIRNLVFEHVSGAGTPSVKIVLGVEFRPRGQYLFYPASKVVETVIALRTQ